jgi:peptidoglycan LD-endopeptidase CwlK
MDKLSLDKIKLIHPKLRNELLTDYIYINKNILGKGVRLRITHTWRSEQEQHQLFLKRPKVTNADSWQSMHNYGLAFDIVILLDKNNDGVFEAISYDLKADSDKDGIADWMEAVKYLKSKGWTWGGDWKFKDVPHFEKTFNNTWKTLKDKIGSEDYVIENEIKYVNL